MTAAEAGGSGSHISIAGEILLMEYRGLAIQTETLMLLSLLVISVAGYVMIATGADAAGGTGTGGAAAGGAAAGAGGSADASGSSTSAGGMQDVYVRALGGANLYKYDKSEIVVQKGVPVRLHFAADKDAGCGKSFVVYGLNIRLTSRNGEEAVAEFTPQDAGTYRYSCSMGMFGPGRLIVQ